MNEKINNDFYCDIGLCGKFLDENNNLKKQVDKLEKTVELLELGSVRDYEMISSLEYKLGNHEKYKTIIKEANHE